VRWKLFREQTVKGWKLKKIQLKNRVLSSRKPTREERFGGAVSYPATGKENLAAARRRFRLKEVGRRLKEEGAGKY